MISAVGTIKAVYGLASNRNRYTFMQQNITIKFNQIKGCYRLAISFSKKKGISISSIRYPLLQTEKDNAFYDS